MKRQPVVHTRLAGVKRKLKKFDLYPAAEIYVMPVKQLVRTFINDEEVEYDFLEEDYIAKTRDRDEEFPQILIASDLHEGDEDEMVISVLHELEHIRGELNEKKAEANARKMFRKVK